VKINYILNDFYDETRLEFSDDKSFFMAKAFAFRTWSFRSFSLIITQIAFPAATHAMKLAEFNDVLKDK